MYGMTLSSKYWYQELQEYLLEEGFIQSSAIPCLFCKKFERNQNLYLLDYGDDLIYYALTNKI